MVFSQTPLQDKAWGKDEVHYFSGIGFLAAAFNCDQIASGVRVPRLLL